jgi:hypothetical protein
LGKKARGFIFNFDFAAKTGTCSWRSGGINRSFRNFTFMAGATFS